MTMKILIQLMIDIFVALYPIMPPFTTIFGLGSSNFIAVSLGSLLAIVLMIYKWGKLNVNKKDIGWIMTVSLLLFIPYVLHGEVYYFLVLFFTRIFVIYEISVIATDKKQLEHILDVLLVIGLFMCLLGLIESFSSWNPFSLIQNNTEVKYSASDSYIRMGVKRVTLSLGHAITTAIYFTLISMLALYKIVTARKTFFYKIVYVLSNVLTVLTLSRWPMLVSAFIQLLFWIKIEKEFGLDFRSGYRCRIKKKHVILCMLLVSVIMILIVISSDKILSNMKLFFGSIVGRDGTGKFGGNSNPFSYRFALIGAILPLAFKHFWVGIGVKNMSTVKFQVSSYGKGWFTSIDNHYLHYFYMLGIFGLLASIIIFGYLFITCKHNKNWFSYCMQLIVIGYMINLFSVSQSYEQSLFCILAGIMLAHKNQEIRNQNCKNREDICK